MKELDIHKSFIQHNEINSSQLYEMHCDYSYFKNQKLVFSSVSGLIVERKNKNIVGQFYFPLKVRAEKDGALLIHLEIDEILKCCEKVVANLGINKFSIEKNTKYPSLAQEAEKKFKQIHYMEVKRYDLQDELFLSLGSKTLDKNKKEIFISKNSIQDTYLFIALDSEGLLIHSANFDNISVTQSIQNFIVHLMNEFEVKNSIINLNQSSHASMLTEIEECKDFNFFEKLKINGCALQKTKSFKYQEKVNELLKILSQEVIYKNKHKIA